MTDAANNTTTTVYDSVHDLPAVVTDAEGNTSCYKYDHRGRKIAEWGTAIQPACFGYDDMDNMTSLRTFRAGTEVITSDPTERTDGDVTTWAFNAVTGLEISKTYADNTTVVKTYDAYKRLATETDARGNIKTHAYEHARGLHLGTTYTVVDGTAETSARSFTYNHLGLLTQLVDDAGTRCFGYNSYGERETDSLVVDGDTHLITEQRDSFGRSTGYVYSKNGTVQQTITTGYGDDGRIASAGFSHGGEQKLFGYTYLAGTNQLQVLTTPNGMTLTQSYETQRDLLTGMAYHRGNTLVVQREYTYDVLGRPTARTTSRQGSVVNDSFIHNSRSELASAQVNGETYGYDYDNVGNRRMSMEAGDYAFYEANELNQYTDITGAEDAADFSFTPTFDADGNQTRIKTETGIWTIVYNAENRPVSFTNEATGTVVTCAYDSMGRRSFKKVTVNGTVTLHQRYLYRGYLQIACIDLTRSHHPGLWLITWDPTQPIATRPLAIQKDGTWYTYGWDLTKNICEIYGASGYIRTAYSYSPFGEISASGDVDQQFQWSSEYFDKELGLNYYNWRYFNSSSGRMNQFDFIKGVYYNPYCINNNNNITFYDYIGLETNNTEEKSWWQKRIENNAKKLNNFIESHLKVHPKDVQCGKEKREACTSVSVIVELGTPTLLSWSLIGHAGIAFDNRFYDFGPNKLRTNIKFIGVGNGYWMSDEYKQHRNFSEKNRKIDTTKFSNIIKNINLFAESFVLVAKICKTKNEAKLMEDRMKSYIKDADLYSIPGQQCASTVYCSFYDKWVIGSPALSPQGLLFKYIVKEKHTCGPNKGKICALRKIKDYELPNNNN